MSSNYQKVFFLFRNNYKSIPLEVFKKSTSGSNSQTTAYKILVSTLMSSRTRDEVTLEASNRLFRKAGNVKALAKLDETAIRELIFPVGFYKTKAKHLLKLSEIILSKYKGRVPRSQKDLMSLPGVGRKTANLVMNSAFGIPAIAVDTHVHKITNLLGWVKTRTPEQTEKELVKILPQKYWSDVNKLFVSIGRQFNTKKKLDTFLKKEGVLNG